MRRSAIALIVPVLLVLVMGKAVAHAFLDHAEPRVGNKVATPPREVTLWFTQKLESAFSSVTVTNAAGQRVDTGKARVSGNQSHYARAELEHTTSHGVSFRWTRIRLTAVSASRSASRAMWF
jgi:methionine-rich copper-binding protein CopC